MNITSVRHIAKLANIPISEQEEESIAAAFTDTLQVVDELKEVDVAGVEPTHQVTGLTNVTRDDVVDEKRMFTQAEAVFNAKRAHNGYFVVERVIDNE
jgi:aspartyl-tRNA(Asn)/glutamyl-tRNA(Gln) amidotransferase subunit C